MANNEYQEHTGKEVYLLVDGRLYGAHATENIALDAKISGETDNNLKLEEIVPSSSTLRFLSFKVKHDIQKFRKATINKRYVIGVFEE